MDSLDIPSEYLDSHLFQKNAQLFIQANFPFSAKKSDAGQNILIHNMCQCFPSKNLQLFVLVSVGEICPMGSKLRFT